jgi:dipeptidyl aminopeptidase/acylaminoacyl peptidase
MTRHVLVVFLSVAASMACGSTAAVQCDVNSSCDLHAGGLCAAGPTGNRWCSYPDPNCPSGFRWSTFQTGDGLSGVCVADVDGGVDAGIDGRVDAMPDTPIDGDTTLRCRIAFEDGVRGSFPGDGSREVWIANVDGTGFVNISNSPSDDFGPTWAPSGLRIAFASNRRGLADQRKDRYDIFAGNVDGTGLTNLTSDSAFSSTSPVWSPDGTRIAFVRGAKLWIMNSDGTGAAQLSTLTPIDFVVWSPDGNKVAFDHFETQGLIVPTIVVTTVGDGSLPVQLTSSSGPERSASWSPAARIVFTSSTSDIVTANADGSNPTNLTMNPADQNESPIWVDNGNTIVFQKRITGHAEVWRISSSGGTATQLTHNSVNNDFIKDASIKGLVTYNHQDSIDAGKIGIVKLDGTGEIFFNAPGGTNSRAGRFSPCP